MADRELRTKSRSLRGKFSRKSERAHQYGIRVVMTRLDWALP
jgi:hypothetical protein